MMDNISRVLLQHSGKFNVMEIPIFRLKGMLKRSELDLEPIYQRGNVWDWNARQNLLLSFFLRLPVGCLSIVKKKHWMEQEEDYYVMDAKQRLTTLLWFFFPERSPSNRLKRKRTLQVEIKTQAGLEKFTWSQIKASQDPLVESTRERFLGHTLTTAVWDYMPVKDQGEIFTQINYSAPQKPAERNYCVNYFCRLLLEKIYQGVVTDCLGKVNTKKGCLQDSVLTNFRFEGLRFVHQIMLLSFDEVFTGVYAPHDTSQNSLLPSAQKINDILSNLLEDQQIDAEDLRKLPDDIVKSGNFVSRITEVKKVCRRLQEILEFDLVKGAKIRDKNLIVDIVSFLMHQVQENEVTHSLLREHREPILNAVVAYQEEKKKSKNKSIFRTHTTDKELHKERLKILSRLFWKHVPFSKGKKNKALTESQKEKAWEESNGKCPGCGSDLTVNNKRDDHKSPKSKYTNTEAQILCDICNAKKSNLDKKDLEQLEKICI